MRFAVNIFVFSLLFSSFFSVAQINKANKNFNNGEYSAAIVLYKKVLKKNAADIQALENTAHSYRLLRDYKNAEIYYATLVQQEGKPASAIFYYAEMLRSNGKAEQAKEQYLKYAAVVPNDKSVEMKIRSLEELKETIRQPPVYQLKQISGINSNKDEFSPVYYKNGLVYVSNSVNDLVYFETSTLDNKPFFDVYFAPIDTSSDSLVKFGNPEQFSKKINSPYHDGPVTFNADQNLIFFEKVDEKKNKNVINRAKLYYSTNINGAWSSPRPFIYNSDEYSVGHPSLSADGQKIYFASDMPGTLGGKDIYVCNKAGEGWSQPINMGPGINTSGDELFPYIRKDGTLFFASNGHTGMGGLDIYMCENKKGVFVKPFNLGAPINSDKDDFGILFDEENKNGFFSSSRENGRGEDIFSFKLMVEFISFEGRILLSRNENNPLKNAKLFLYKEDGTLLKTSYTDDIGAFSFRNLPVDQKYIVKLDENDPSLNGKHKVYLADEDNRIVSVTVVDKAGNTFHFKSLPPDIKKLPYFEEEDVAFSGRLILNGDTASPLSNVKITLYDEAGNIVGTETTNNNGVFSFRSLPPDKNYNIKIEEWEDTKLAGQKITLVNTDGKIIKESLASSKKGYEYSLLPADINEMPLEELVDVALAGRMMHGANADTPLSNTQISVYSENGELIETVTTDANGRFVFKSLPPDKKYTIKIENADDTKLGDIQIVMLDNKGKIVKKAGKEAGSYEFKILPSDMKNLPYEEVVDNNISIAGNFMYGDDGTKPLSNAKVGIYNDGGKLIGTAQTNESGAFVFTSLPPGKNYKIKIMNEDDPRLSDTKLTMKNKNGDVMSSTMVKNGKGFEYTLLSADKKNMAMMTVEDTELSETIEGRVMNEQKQPIYALLIKLINEKGKVLTSVTTNKDGKFIFRNLPAGKNYIFQVDESDSRLAAMGKIFITDAKNNMIREIVKDRSGKFSFRLLPAEHKIMVTTFVDDPLLKVVNIANKVKINSDKKNEVTQAENTRAETNVLIVDNIIYPPDEIEIVGDAAHKTMKKILSLMSKDKSLVLHIGSYTDSKQTEEYNLKLSEKRAQFALEYLTSRGISKRRITGKGYGESQPVNTCVDGVECSEEEHARNRRTEFKFSRLTQ